MKSTGSKQKLSRETYNVSIFIFSVSFVRKDLEYIVISIIWYNPKLIDILFYFWYVDFCTRKVFIMFFFSSFFELKCVFKMSLQADICVISAYIYCCSFSNSTYSIYGMKPQETHFKSQEELSTCNNLIVSSIFTNTNNLHHTHTF